MNNKNNINQPIKEDLKSATNSLLKILKDISKDIQEEYKVPEKDLQDEQKAELAREEIKDRESNRNLRENYARKMFWYMCIWSGIVLFILVCSGFQCFGFQLDKWALVTLIGSTTVSVFAIVRAIIEGLFKHKN